MIVLAEPTFAIPTDQFIPAPEGLATELWPAEFCLYEWIPYWLQCPGVDELRIGQQSAEERHGDWFLVRFENQLGRTSLQPLRAGRPVGPPLHVEVISTKFGTPHEHCQALRTLIDDLFAQAAQLPFTVSEPTSRGVTESLRPPTPLFMLHFLCQHQEALRAAVGTVLANPHRELRDFPERVPIAQASEADADVLLDILMRPEDLRPARGFRLAEALGGYAPERVWQRLPEETLDTPPNRFARHFLRQVLTAAQALPAQGWWPNVPAERRRSVTDTAGLLQEALGHSALAEVGQMTRFPSSSQALLRRDGYRELLQLWQAFHQARRPLFGALEHAIEVRDIATLYEFWVFFRLARMIGEMTGEQPAADLQVSDQYGLRRSASVRFGGAGRLLYNQSFSRSSSRFPSYSLPLRPDYVWVRNGRPEVALDAKFRLEWRDVEVTEEDEDRGSGEPRHDESVAKREDLYKMHTYRDALGVRAGVAVYPGHQPVFYETKGTKRSDVTLESLLLGQVEGIGALPMRPR